MKRELAADLLATSGLGDGLLRARKFVRLPLLTVLTYHRLVAPDPAFELDPGTLDSDPATFELHLDAIESHFQILRLSDLLHHRYGKPLPPNPLLLTFDDGYRDNVEVVLPILRRRGISAVFFIATGFPDAGKLYWWDRAALLLRRCRRDPVVLRASIPLTLEPVRDLQGSTSRLLRAIKRTRGLDLDALFDELSRASGVVLDADEERAIAERTVMTWNEVRALAAAGMDVGSHSHTHRVMSTLSPEQILEDLRRSREVLTRELGVAPRAVAYPVGHPLTRRERDVIARSGFELGFTNATGVAETWRLDPLQIPRIAMDREIDRRRFRALLALPYLSHRAGVERAREDRAARGEADDP